jgi:hypothetical protein
MSRSTTTRLLLSKPDPGTGEPYDVSIEHGSNLDKVDGAVGFTPVTAATRPTGADAWDGRPIRETDTGLCYVLDEDGTNWRQILADTGAGFIAQDQLIDVRRTGTAAAHRIRNIGDTVARLEVDSNGKLSWGAGGASAVDVTLYRGAADRLQTDDDLYVAGGRSLPRGIMATPVSTSTNGTATSGTTETRDAILGDYVFTSAGTSRQYRVVIENLIGNGSQAGDVFQIRVRDGGGSTPTALSTLIAETCWTPISLTGTSSRAPIPYAITFTAASGTRTLSMFVVRTSGGGTFTPLASAGNGGTAARKLYVEDIGQA